MPEARMQMRRSNQAPKTRTVLPAQLLPPGKSTTQFIRPQFVPEVRKQLASYKKFKALTENWVALALELSKLKMQEARSTASKQVENPRS
jgi:hypothetical protein